MNLSEIFAKLSGAQNFANNPANGFQSTFGDGLQGIGHSMAQHYRGQGGRYGGPGLIPGETTNASGAGIDPKNLGLDLTKLFPQPQVNGGPNIGEVFQPQTNPGLPTEKPPQPQIFRDGITGTSLPAARPRKPSWGQDQQNPWGLGQIF